MANKSKVTKGIVAFAILLATLSSSAFAVDINLGDTTVSLDLSDIGDYDVEESNTVENDHNEKDCEFTYELYSAKITGPGDYITLELYKVSKSMSDYDYTWVLEHTIEESSVYPFDGSSKSYDLGGKDGILVSGFTNKGHSSSLYTAAAGLDNGYTFLVIGSSYPWENTRDIFDSIEYS